MTDQQIATVLEDRIAALKLENAIMASAPPFAERASAALMGAFVADSASLGTHWIYDPEALKTASNIRGQPEFAGWEGPKRLGPFYNHEEFPGHYDFGSLSPYGEQLMLLTQHTASQGKIEGTALADATYKWAKAYTGRPDHAIKVFVENMDKPDKSGQWPNCGADDSQAHCFIRVVPVTILYAGSAEREAKVEEAIRVGQNNDVAVKFGLAASGILNDVLLGKTLAEAVSEAKGRAQADAEVSCCFDKASASQDRELVDFLGDLSKAMIAPEDEKPFLHKARSCGLPGSFMGPVHQIVAAGDGVIAGDDTYVKCLRANIVAAGDTCSRAIFLGAVIGAAAASVPAAWVAKFGAAGEVAAFGAKIIAARSPN